jgi:flagellar basal-body rod modification protein FlgD
MTTSSVGSYAPVKDSSAQSTTSNATSQLNTNDFINMMMTQLQHQDPLNPTTSDQLMSQMSQIGQLQSTSQLQTTLTGLATQTQIGAASSLMGKQVTGLDVNSNPITGVVATVQVTSGGVNLQLKDGSTLALSNVSSISEPPAAAGA